MEGETVLRVGQRQREVWEETQQQWVESWGHLPPVYAQHRLRTKITSRSSMLHNRKHQKSKRIRCVYTHTLFGVSFSELALHLLKAWRTTACHRWLEPVFVACNNLHLWLLAYKGKCRDASHEASVNLACWRSYIHLARNIRHRRPFWMSKYSCSVPDLFLVLLPTCPSLL